MRSQLFFDEASSQNFLENLQYSVRLQLSHLCMVVNLPFFRVGAILRVVCAWWYRTVFLYNTSSMLQGNL